MPRRYRRRPIPSDLVAARFASQLLGEERGSGVAEVAGRLLAVQAQDLRSARLAIRARTHGLTAADVDRELTVERSVAVGWLNRGTLHLVHREDYWWLHALTTPPLFKPVARRLAQLGVSPDDAERGVATIARSLGDGPLTRLELRDRLDAVGVPTAGQALVHLLMLGCLQGIAVRGPIQGKQHAYVLAHDWLGAPPKVDRERALAELGRRYLAGHAPADEYDLAKWAGLPLRDARAGLVGVTTDGPAAAATPGPCLLDQWDPVLVGWRSRAPLLAAYPKADNAEAHFHPFAYVAGRAVATWRARRGAVEIDEPFTRVSAANARRLAADAADVERFLQARLEPSEAGNR